MSHRSSKASPEVRYLCVGDDTANTGCVCEHACSISFDVRERYQHLLEYYTGENWQHEMEWMTRRLEQLSRTCPSVDK